MTSETLNVVITAIVVPVLAVLVPLLIAFITTKTKEIKDKINDAKVSKYIDIAEDAVQTAVIMTYQTFVAAIKGTDGWTPAVQEEAFQRAKLDALALMGTTTREMLATVYADLDVWIASKIQVYISVNKGEATL